MEKDPKSPLKYSRPLDVHRWSDYPEVKRAVAGIARELSELNPKQKKHLRIVVLDLYAAWLYDPCLYVGYSRNENDYQIDSRYNQLHIGYTAMIAVIDRLEACGYIEHHKGFHDRKTGVGFQSRMRATRKLIDVVRRGRGVEEYMIERPEGEEVILLKDTAGQLAEYQDTPITMLMRAQLEVINQWLGRTRIDLAIPDKDFKHLLQRLKRDSDRGTMDFSRKRLKRIFNNGSFEEGGRFYLGWWQEVPRDYRKYITINGQITEELDYSGMHVRLLYAWEGLDMDGDPYELSMPGVTRDTIKRIANILLNAGSPASARRAITPDMADHDKREKVLEGLFKKHEAIRGYFHTGIGVRLQYWDSVIAEQVMLYMYGRYQEPILPVHDSFLVQFRSVSRLREAMEEVFKEVSRGVDPQITGKKRRQWNMKTVKGQEELEEWFKETRSQVARGEQEAMRVQKALERHGELRHCSVHTKWKGAGGTGDDNEQWIRYG